MRRAAVFPWVPEVLQQLFVSCREIFKGPGTVPPASDVNKLRIILDKMKAEDVGLSKNLHFFKARGAVKGTPRVTLRLARLKANSAYTAPCDTSVLYPTTGGNIHEFTAVTPCAVLDVMGPPYSKDDGRDCSFYKDFPYWDHEDGRTRRVSEEERDVMDGCKKLKLQRVQRWIELSIWVHRLDKPPFRFINIL
ncbi:Plant cysteine oxidase 2 [Hibiscus syriacus]|uniref:cysteine dioxygenase n=1 Tax=Hibiscus syriacus TaxID=106335 RepID=A0A6A2XR73_HIBSY|nr:Plant cysteine oxidase 2 [Hibiscus syriacus]